MDKKKKLIDSRQSSIIVCKRFIMPNRVFMTVRIVPISI